MYESPFATVDDSPTSLPFDPAKPTDAAPAKRYRSIWISDLHLGTRNSQVGPLLDFFRATESDYLYLVGDIIDGWQLKKSWFWNQQHNDVIQKILRKARKGTTVFLIPGNHDEFLRAFVGHQFGLIRLEHKAIHRTADGRSFLVIHGDQFDGVMQHARWLAFVGDQAYDFALFVNRWVNFVRKRCGYPYFSLSSYLKQKVKNAVSFISSYEQALVLAARRHKTDGVICGHIHKAEMRMIEGTLYCNDGDWVESRTALVEHFDGRLEILNWTEDAGQAVAAVEPKVHYEMA